MTSISDAQAAPLGEVTEEVFWSTCPECGCPEHHFNTPSLYEIYQVCNGCGSMSHNHHFMAAEFEAWQKQQKEKAA